MSKTVTITTTPDYYSTKEQVKVTGYNKKIVKCDYNKTTGKIAFTAKKTRNTTATVKVGNESKKIKIKVNK